jgi:hypothetical protein
MLNISPQKFEINGLVIENEGFQDIPVDSITKLLESYSEEDKAQITDKLSQLEKQNNKAFKNILPQGVMPIYLSPLDPETEVLQTATWNQYSDVGPYAEFDDSYCRPDLANKNSYVYPRRNPETQEIELNSCDKLINTDIKEMANLSQYLTTFNDLAKVKLLELNSNDVNSSTRFKTDINKKLNEYNKLHDQYIQLSNLLQTNIDLINKRKKMIDGQRDNVDSAENDYDIRREIVGDDMQNTRDREKLLVQSRIALKVFGVLFILITVGLVLLIDIGKVL